MSPKAQGAIRYTLVCMKKYEEALREFKKLLKEYPKSFEASESQYCLGLIEESRQNYYEAYLAYQKLIDKYPFSERIKDVIERQYDIAGKFMSGYKRKALGISLPVENPAIEIYNKVIENSTYGPFSQRRNMFIGSGLQRYFKAEDA